MSQSITLPISDEHALLTASIGKVIRIVTLSEHYRECGALRIEFTDDTSIDVYDGGQDCCEHRYPTTDDDLTYYAGARLLGIEVRNVEVREEDCYCREIAFLHVTTSLGVFVIETHNDHNGYYGGFGLAVATID